MKKVLSITLSILMMISTASVAPFAAHALDASGTCGENVTYTFDESTGELVISGTGEMYETSPFSNNTNIKTVVINEGVTSLPKNAFSSCEQILIISLPESLISIGENAFYSCKKLASVNIPSGVTTINKQTFYNCVTLVKITIPEGVSSIGERAFGSCTKLSSLSLPSTIKTIEKYAFASSGLTRINLPDGLTSIAQETFSGCGSLTNISIPDSVTTIGSSAFNGCSSLENISLPANLLSIDNGAFSGCTKLTALSIPTKVVSLGSSLLSYCNSLKSLYIPSSVLSIGFLYECCPELESIVIDKDNPVYDSRDNCNAIIETDTNVLLHGCKNTKIPYGVTTINGNAFNRCFNLKNIVIPKTVTHIGAAAFFYCSSLESVTIPKSVTNIGQQAFSYCLKLNDVYYLGTEEQWDIVNNSNSIRNEATIHFGSIEEATYDESGETIISYPSDNTEEEYTIPETVKVISDGAFENENLKTVVISENVETIGEDAFAGCPNLETVVFADNSKIETIGTGAFKSTSVKNIILPKYVKTVGENAFEGCSELEKVVFEDAEEDLQAENDIAESTAVKFSSLKISSNFHFAEFKSASLATDEKSIGSKAFHNCPKLAVVDIPSTVTKIADDAFDANDKLIIVCEYNSVAHTYAKKHGVRAFGYTEVPDQYYTGKAIKPDVQVYGYKDTLLDRGSDYYLIYQNNINIGFATVTINGIGDYEGASAKIKFRIIKAPTSSKKLNAKTLKISLSKNSFVYDGKVKKPSYKVKTSSGKIVTASNYSVSYQKGRKNVGTYTVTFKFKGNYTGTVKKTFKIVPKATGISKVTAKSKGFAVKWKKQTAQVTGYQIQYSTSAKFKNAKTLTVKNNKTVAKTVGKLKANKKYYVRIRTYKTVNKKNYYSAWSKSKSVKTKK